MFNPQPACDPVEGFVWPSLGFCCGKISYTLAPVHILIILNLTYLMQVASSATLLCLLPFQLGFEQFVKLNLVC